MIDKKEIIIDGVDASQCVYRMKDEYNTCCCTSTKENEGKERITAYYGCKYNHNCYYKQLKHKEQECEKKSWEIGNLGYKNKNQRREINERLRQIEKLKQWKKGAENLFKAQIDNPDNIINRYKQALDEIRQYRVCEINDIDGEEGDVILEIIDEVREVFPYDR